MRWKIIIVNAGIVLIVAGLTYALLAAGLESAVADPTARRADAERAVRSANAQLQLDGARLETWLAEEVATEAVQGVFSVGTARARSERATSEATRIRDAVAKADMFTKMAPSMVLFVDAQGVAIGRDGSNLLRGDKMADSYPSLAKTLKQGRTRSDIWLNRAREEQMLVSYAPVHSGSEIVGALVVGTPLNDERLTRTSELTSGRGLVLLVKGASAANEVVAKSNQTAPDAFAAVQTQPAQAAARASLAHGTLGIVSPSAADYLLGTAPLAGYGDNSAAIIAAVPASVLGSTTTFLWPVFAVAGLGLLLVFLGGTALGNYISEPIAEMEDGLLQVINGKTDLRFQIEHPDLGGLISRINSLLNAMTGVPETDEEGRTSTVPEVPYE